MDEKPYLIDTVKFRLKEDLDLDESLEASKLLKIFYSPSQSLVVGESTGDDIKQFFGIVLEPVDGKPLPDGFNFGKVKGSVQGRIFKDFFLAKVREANVIGSDFASSMKQLLEQ